MRLKKYSYKNHKTGWNVKDVQFGLLTLLVGASGVGKTQILRSIKNLSGIAGGRSFEGVEWSVVFEENNHDYVWSGRFEYSDSTSEIRFFEEPEFAVVDEKLVVDGSEVIFTRTREELIYHDKPTVKLDSTVSAVELLKEEPDIAIVKNAFRKIGWLAIEEGTKFSIRPGLFSKDKLQLSLSEIKNLKHHTPIDKLFLIMNSNRKVFDNIKELFIDIFPLVENVDFELGHLYNGEIIPILKIKEKDVDRWIKIPDISSGMCRTLSQIVAITLADDGDIILIDEFENGLGINCIDSLAEMAMEPDVNIQLIMTSHHPYIINTIPFRDWRIVSRKGSDVMVNTAADLKIGEFSKHDAFMQLIQTPAYLTGQL